MADNDFLERKGRIHKESAARAAKITEEFNRSHSNFQQRADEARKAGRQGSAHAYTAQQKKLRQELDDSLSSLRKETSLALQHLFVSSGRKAQRL